MCITVTSQDVQCQVQQISLNISDYSLIFFSWCVILKENLHGSLSPWLIQNRRLYDCITPTIEFLDWHELYLYNSLFSEWNAGMCVQSNAHGREKKQKREIWLPKRMDWKGEPIYLSNQRQGRTWSDREKSGLLCWYLLVPAISVPFLFASLPLSHRQTAIQGRWVTAALSVLD